MKKIVLIITVLSLLSCSEKTSKQIPVRAKQKENINTRSDTTKLVTKTLIEEPTNFYGIPFGQINDTEFIYDCLDCKSSTSGEIIVHSKKNKSQKKLFNLDVEDFYLHEIKLLNIKNNYFIYVQTDHTYGHSQGYLYYLNVERMITFPVKIIPKYEKVAADTMHVHKYMNLITSDYKTFKNGYTYFERQDNGNGDPIYLEYEMILKKKGENNFVLLCK